jgi:3-hydroxyisobutyrate dehydrogenase-like beta-hydroxyacid dehydrogenase
MSNTYDVAIVGCGLMGAAFARTLAGRGLAVAAWNRSFERAEALVDDGITAVRSIDEAVRSTPVLIACTTNYETTLAALEPVTGWDGTTLVTVTSGTPAEAEEMQRWAADRGVAYLDGDINAYPQAIGSPEAQLLYSGPAAVWADVEPTLAHLGTSLYVAEEISAANALFLAIGAFYLPALGAYVEAATYVLSQGISAEALRALTASSLAMLGHTTEEAVVAIESGRHETDQATLEIFAEGARGALTAMHGGGHRGRLLGAAIENLEAAESAGLGKLGFYAQTEVARH